MTINHVVWLLGIVMVTATREPLVQFVGIMAILMASWEMYKARKRKKDG